MFATAETVDTNNILLVLCLQVQILALRYTCRIQKGPHDL